LSAVLLPRSWHLLLLTALSYTTAVASMSEPADREVTDTSAALDGTRRASEFPRQT
jgi:hypothetical protein